MPYSNESALIKYGEETLSVSRGSPARVKFNWMKLLQFRGSLGKDFDPRKLGFYHVHPPGFPTFSGLDVECADGFTRALGHPVFFAIILFEDDDWDNLRHRQLSYRFEDGTLRPDPRADAFYQLDLWHLAMLKSLSYAEEVS